MSWLEDLGTYLQTNSIGTLGSSIFYENFDSSVINSVILIAQAGPAPSTTLGNTMTLRKPELGIRVRNSDDSTAHTKAESIFDLLNDTYNTTIGSTRFKSIRAIADPFFVGQSKNDSYIYSINFAVRIG